MSATYNTSLATDMDKVRFFIGDTDVANALLTDEEILAVLGMYPNVITASIICCKNLIAKYSRYADETVGQVSVSYSSMVDNMKSVVSGLEARLAGSCSPFCGGISISGKEQQEQDTDRVKPFATKDMHSSEVDNGETSD